ncbi:MAG TPA: winged helix-turn-helix domain-containing protein, partial [Candidatus Brocadiia bacterium]|nr:winged helix-turn-helix domain-containing protein [Candidatus Brocadiia bacterium]
MITRTENGRMGYREVRRHLLGRISSGEFPLYSRLPTIQETCRELGVSYVTAQRAYRTLADEGMVKSVRGQASVVIAEAPRKAPAARVVGGLFRAVRARNDVDNYALEMYEAVCHELAAHGVGVLHRGAMDPASVEGLCADIAAERVAGVIADEVTPDAAL